MRNFLGGGGFIVYLLRKKRLYIKYALAWLLTVVTLVLLALFPEAVRGMAYFFGLKTPVNFIYVVEGAFVLCILLICTVIMSHMNSRIVRLIQVQGILEKRVRDLEVMAEKKGVNMGGGKDESRDTYISESK